MLFLLHFSLFFLLPYFLPTYCIQAFTPYLVFKLANSERIHYLWRCFFCGLIVDLFSSSIYFGQTACIYTLLGALFYHHKETFFMDKWPSLPLLTALFTSLSTLLSAFFLSFVSGDFYFSAKWMVTDLLQMPFIEAAVALLIYSLPFQIRELWRKMQINKRLRAS